MFKNCKNLDERQLKQRGDVFMHVCLLLFVLLLAEGFLKAEEFTWAEGMYECLLIVWAGLALAFSEFILREITPMGARMGVFYVCLGVCGAFLIGLALFSLLFRQEPLLVGHTLTVMGGTLAEGSLMAFIFCLFLGKTIYNRFRAAKGDEDD